MTDGIEEFKEQYPSLDSYWRSIILFGRNVASYKFALAKSLLEIAPTGKTHITLEELSTPFSRHLCEHIAKSDRVTSGTEVYTYLGTASYIKHEGSRPMKSHGSWIIRSQQSI